MTWKVFGTSVRLSLRHLSIKISGNGTQDAMLVNTDSFQPDRIDAVWSIHSTRADEVDYDPNGEGLRDRIAARPDSSHFMITHHPRYDDNSPEAVGFSICLPPDVFEHHLMFWQEMVFRGASVRYSIILDFVGFSVPGNNFSTTPTVHEWLKKKRAFGSGVEVRFHRDTSEP